MKNPLLVLLFLPLSAHGIIVTTSSDEDNGSLGGGAGISLREAVKYSAPGNSIAFSSALSGQTIRLTLGPLQIFNSLIIDASTLPAGLTLSADRTGNGKTPDDTYAILLIGGSLLLDSIVLADANCGESSGCITIQPTATFTLTLDHCTLTRNAGYHASALYCYSYQPRPTDAITIRNSTVSGNSVVKGSSVFEVFYTNLTIQNSTFSQNEAGAISYRAGNPPATLSILNSTISNNSFKWGASGLYLDLEYLSPPATIYINNTICAGNASTNIYISPGLTLSGSNNILTGNPLLAPLDDYGGPTRTMPPLPGSPALGAASWPPALPADQRGFPRVDKPEIGAVELQNSDHTRFWKLDFDGDGSPYGVEQALGTDNFVPDSGNIRNLTAPTFDSSGQAILRFGKAGAVTGTRWVLERSPDLNPVNFKEVYRYSSSSEIMAPGITCVRTSSSFTVTDSKPPAGQAFYRFEAVLTP